MREPVVLVVGQTGHVERVSQLLIALAAGKQGVRHLSVVEQDWTGLDCTELRYIKLRWLHFQQRLVCQLWSLFGLLSSVQIAQLAFQLQLVRR